MGDLNNIQDEIMAEMLGDLADVSYPFTGERKEPIEPYDPDNPDQYNTVNYSGDGIFGLSFTQSDTQIFQIEQNDQKAIVFVRSSNNTPKVEDKITYNGLWFKIIQLLNIPADNGWVMQLRRV